MEKKSEKTNGESDSIEVSRRDFLKIGMKTILVASAAIPFLKSRPLLASVVDQLQRNRMAQGYQTFENEQQQLSQHYADTEHYWAYVIDPMKCIGCGKCVRACKSENNVPDTFYRTWIERYVYFSHDNVRVDSPEGGLKGFPDIDNPEKVVKSFFIPKMCNHCEESVCVQVCPVGATFDSPDGVVLVDKKHCIGCGYCIQACPYGCRFKNPQTHTADKCTLCYHRITKGLTTACISACPRGTRTLVDIKNKNDKELLAFFSKATLNVLKPELGTKPKLYYTVLDKEVK